MSTINNSSDSISNPIESIEPSKGIADLDIIITSLQNLRQNMQLKGILPVQDEIDPNYVKTLKQINENMTQDILKLDMVVSSQFKLLRKDIIRNIQCLQSDFDEIMSNNISSTVIDF